MAVRALWLSVCLVMLGMAELRAEKHDWVGSATCGSR